MSVWQAEFGWVWRRFPCLGPIVIPHRPRKQPAGTVRARLQSWSRKIAVWLSRWPLVTNASTLLSSPLPDIGLFCLNSTGHLAPLYYNPIFSGTARPQIPRAFSFSRISFCIETGKCRGEGDEVKRSVGIGAGSPEQPGEAAQSGGYSELGRLRHAVRRPQPVGHSPVGQGPRSPCGRAPGVQPWQDALCCHLSPGVQRLGRGRTPLRRCWGSG